MNYDELVKELRVLASWKPDGEVFERAADAIEELLSDYSKLYEKHVDLLKAAKAMHTWIFLHTGDEQEAYDECGLSDEMNVELGYSGQWELRATPPKEET